MQVRRTRRSQVKREPLPAKELFQLKVGDKFVVFWAKDDDPQYTRLNYVTQTIVETDGNVIHVDDDGYEWSRDELVTDEENMLDTSRGYAYFYKART